MAAQSYQKQSALDNDYLYNGKGLQDEHNLGWMDYGARMYMPCLCWCYHQNKHTSGYEEITLHYSSTGFYG